MTRKVRVVVTLLIALLVGAAWSNEQRSGSASQRAAGQSAIATLDALNAKARDARRREDWKAYQSAMAEQQRFLNDAPLSLLDSARAAARAGERSAALRDLADYARMGEGPTLTDSLPELGELRSLPAFRGIRDRLASNLRGVSHGSLLHTIPDPGLLPEDIDFDLRGRRFLLTSVLRHKIVAVDARGSVSDFAAAPDGWPMLALRIDAAHRQVWVTEVAMEGFASVPRSDQGRSALLRFDLDSGALLQRIEAPRPTALGDMALLPGGTPVVSDGEHGGVYRLRADGHELERVDAGQFISPQTPAVLGDGERLLVPDYVRGLAILNTSTRAVSWFDSQRRFTLTGVDGMYLCGQALILVRNGTTPARISSLSVDLPHTRVVAERVLERASPTLGVPTHGVCAGGQFFYIANSGWDAVDEHGVPSGTAPGSAPYIMRMRIR